MAGVDVAVLVAAALDHDEAAWEALVRRYEPLIASYTRRYRLSAADAADVSQTVWSRVVGHLGRLRDARALPGWISATTAHACLDVVTRQRRTVCVDPTVLANPTRQHAAVVADPVERAEIDAALVRHERDRAIREGLAELTPSQRELLLLLVAEPPMSYLQISALLGVPVGSIGPTRARCLEKLGRTQAIRRLIAPDARLSRVNAAA